MPPKAVGIGGPGEGGGEGDENEMQSNQKDSAQAIEAFLDGNFCTFVMTLATFYALLANEINYYVCPKSADGIFEIGNTIALVLFVAEFLANTIAKADYKWSFFFYLDIIAAVSITADIEWLGNWVNQVIAHRDDGSNTNTDAGKTARLARLVRLVRLIRIVKLYTMISKAQDAEQEERMRAQARAASNAKQAALKRVEASRLGKVLSEQTTRKVIVGVLSMLIVLPMLSATEVDQTKHWGLQTLFWFGQSDCRSMKAMTNLKAAEYGSLLDGGLEDGWQRQPTVFCHHQNAGETWIFEEGWKAMVYQYSRARVERDFEDDGVIETVREKLLWLRIPRLDQGGALRDIEEVDLREETGDERWYWEQYENCNGTTLPDECPYREKETVLVTYTPEECLQPPLKGTNACQEVAAHARFEFKQDSQADARTQLIRMAVVCFVLLTLSLQFQTDTQILVIAPIEKMVNIIKQLAEDPLRPPDAIVVEDVVEVSRDTKKKKGGPQLETSMLENTILRIGELLQRGFGAAGAEIVGANMSSGDGDLNIMTPGLRVNAIFGWTNVRDFTYATGVLEEDVVCFVNTIGRIVQGCVHRWSGVANKNIGDAFVVLWKVPEMDLSNQKKNGNTAGATAADTVNKISETSDRALMGFVKILAECRRSADIDFYNGHHQLRKGRPRWRVRIGMALHVGWAIEGPIGSDYKIDASYLSPAVSMCEMLECSTKVYGTPLISSESHYKLLSLRAKERMRKIDVVKMMDKVTGLYAYNVNFASRIDDRATEHFEIGELSKDEGLMDISSETLEKEGAEFLFVIDRDVAKLQEGIPEELNLDYREALCQLLEGNWDAALEVLVRILREIWPGDGPSEALYRFMKETNFKCPANWNGYHVLDDDALAKAALKEPITFVEEESAEAAEQSKKPTSRSAAAAAARRQSVGESVGDDTHSVATTSQMGEAEALQAVVWRPGDWR